MDIERLHRARVLKLAICLLLLALLVGLTPSDALEVEVLLVPSEHWKPDTQLAETARHALPEGQVHFYRRGSYHPEITIQAGESVALPRGSWTWIGEAPGYVSVTSGEVSSGGEGRDGVAPKRLLWGVVPACRLSLDEHPSWKSLDRVDIVSLDYGAVYPIMPKRRQSAWVPAGRWVAYTVARGQLLAISQPRSCAKEQALSMAPPARPARDRQSLLAQVTLPESLSLLDGSTLAYLRGEEYRASTRTIEPSAIARQGQRLTLFFLDVPADARWLLEVRHPRAQTLRLDLEPFPGEARELEPQELLLRSTLVLEVDYQPKQPHQHATVIPLDCGKEQGFVALRHCRALEDQALPLKPGSRTYRFENLDWGQYAFEAQVDEFRLEGMGRPLGEAYQPFIANGPPQELFEGGFAIKEMHLYGHIQRDQEPVEGWVELFDPSRRKSTRSVTDEELLYHLYYFAAAGSGYDLTPEEREAGMDPARLTPGLPSPYSLSFCALDGVCRSLPPKSRIRGEGRLDLAIDDGTELLVRVHDKRTGEPLSDAVVLVRNEDRQALLFENGEITWFGRRGMEGDARLSDDQGVVLLGSLPPGQQHISVQKAGYEVDQAQVALPPEGRREHRFELEPKREASREDARLFYADGEPVAGAFLLPIQGDGKRDFFCYAVSGRDGFARLKRRCRAGRPTLLLHPSVPIQLLPEGALVPGAELIVQRIQGRPLRLRVTSTSGEPLHGLPVRLVYSQFAVDSNDTLAAAVSGSLLFHATSASGELFLQGVDPTAPEVPNLVVEYAGSKAEVSLLGYSAGETVEVTMP